MNTKMKKNLVLSGLAVLIFACGFGGGFALGGYVQSGSAEHKDFKTASEGEFAPAMPFDSNGENAPDMENGAAANGNAQEGGFGRGGRMDENFTAESLLNSLSDEQKQQLMDATGKSEEELKNMDIKELFDAMRSSSMDPGSGKGGMGFGKGQENGMGNNGMGDMDPGQMPGGFDPNNSETEDDFSINA